MKHLDKGNKVSIQLTCLATKVEPKKREEGISPSSL